MAEWLVPFKGRNPSGVYNQNFLWRDSNVYVMDNHRAALWCWVQHLEKGEAVNLLHIDRHWDTLYSRIDYWVRSCPDLWSMGIEDYLSYRGAGQDVPLFRWDNYASIFLEVFGPTVEQTIFATHGDGDRPRHRHLCEAQPWELPGNLRYWLKGQKAPWICNIDLDYFVYLIGDKKDSDGGSFLESENYPDDEPIIEDGDDGDVSDCQELFSQAYCSELFTVIRREMESGRIKALTLCLSPEFSGGWDLSETLCRRACDTLGLNFSLPDCGHSKESGE